ncbi:MAG: HD domain-containing protein [Lachnospiraceae bacterium]|nr:HD domain-containing protein [Lachnospiraceae bacterium]
MDIKNTNLYNELVKRESGYIDNINKVYALAEEFLPKINRVFVNYTGHGIEHSLNVIQYMFDLINDINMLSDLEITCLIYSALLHDVGMVVSEKEIKEIRVDKLLCNGMKYSAIHEKVQDDLECIQECVRPIHGIRSYDFVMKNMKVELFLVPGYKVCSFQEEVAEICQAHTMELEYTVKQLKNKDIKGENRLNAQYVAMLLRIADYLDLDERRAPVEVYKFISPTGYGDEEWKQHYIISNKNKIESSATNRKKIVLYGQCKNPKIHNKFLKYLDDVTREISWWVSYSRSTFEDIYWLLLDETIENRIETVGFEVSDLKLNVDYSAIVKLLMGENVYGNKKYGLRELIQNSLDACKVMKEYAPQLECYKYDEYVPKIQIILDYGNNQLRIRDNGIGMSEEVLKKYFLNIGKSYYKSNDYMYQGNKYNPIGNFGIGFLACFMLSKEVIVETKSFKEETGYALVLYADSEYICKKVCGSFKNTFGTMISLNLCNALAVFDNDVKRIISFLKSTFLDQGIDIYVEEIKPGEAKLSHAIGLLRYEEIIEGKCILDKYFDEISYAVQIEGMPKPKKMFSELELSWFPGMTKVCRFNESNKMLESIDMEFKEFKEYLYNGYLMFIKISGVKKVYNDELKKLKELCKKDILLHEEPLEWREEIVFPISYREGFVHLFDGGWCGNETIRWKTILGKYENLDVAWIRDNLVDVMKQCDFIDDLSEVSVELGVVSLLEVGQDRYLELKYSMNNVVDDNDRSATFWKGIQLEKARMRIDIGIQGMYLGEYYLNINNKRILPNISRDDLAREDEDEIRRQMEIAVYRHIVESVNDREVANAIEQYAKEIVHQ